MEIEVEIHKHTQIHIHIYTLYTDRWVYRAVQFHSYRWSSISVSFLTVTLLLIKQFVATIYEVSNLVIENRAENGSQQRDRSTNYLTVVGDLRSRQFG